MSHSAKSIVVGIAIGLLVGAMLGYFLQIVIDDTESRIADLQSQIDQKSSQIMILESQMSDRDDQIDDLQSQIDNLQDQVTQLNSQIRSRENMVLIPAGTFLMGREDREGWSPMADPEMFNDELPAHEVYLDAFYIDKYEVTNRQFKEFADATGYVTDAEKHGYSEVIVPADQADWPINGTDIGVKLVMGAYWYAPDGPESSIDDFMDHPVVHVSWNDANAYAEWIGKRLPTEAEWEKAARGGSNTNWFWSDELDNAGEYANFFGEHRKDYIYPEEAIDGYEKTAPVGSLQPNNYGLYDTAGNVVEWTADWYQYDCFSNSSLNNPKGPVTGDGKVVKDGCWILCECYIRPANRESRESNEHDHGIGFRLALDLNP